MRSISMGLFGALLLTLAAHPARADIFDDHPQDDEATLSNGRRVRLPLHLYDYDQSVLGGAAPRALVQAEIEETGLFVAPLTDLGGNVISEELTSVSIFVIDYHDTSIGRYRETIVTVPVFDATGRFGYYVLSMHVTSRHSQLVGREVLGLPKTLGVIVSTEPAVGDWAFAYGDTTGVIASGVCDDCGQLPSFPLNLDFQVATTSPITGDVEWFRIVTETASFSTRNFDPSRDAFWFNRHTPVGATLQRIGFAVNANSIWMISRGVQGVTFAP